MPTNPAVVFLFFSHDHVMQVWLFSSSSWSDLDYMGLCSTTDPISLESHVTRVGSSLSSSCSSDDSPAISHVATAPYKSKHSSLHSCMLPCNLGNPLTCLQAYPSHKLLSTLPQAFCTSTAPRDQFSSLHAAKSHHRSFSTCSSPSTGQLESLPACTYVQIVCLKPIRVVSCCLCCQMTLLYARQLSSLAYQMRPISCQLGLLSTPC